VKFRSDDFFVCKNVACLVFYQSSNLHKLRKFIFILVLQRKADLISSRKRIAGFFDQHLVLQVYQQYVWRRR